MHGVDKIRKERIEQLNKHTWSAEHDDKENDQGQLKDAALYCLTLDNADWPYTWAEVWKEKFFMKSYEDRLIVAGALIAAELDRIDRLKKKNGSTEAVASES